MANYQNNIRYGRQTNMRQMRPSCGNFGTSPASCPESGTGCNMARSMPGSGGDCGVPFSGSRSDTRCSTPVSTAKTDAGCNTAERRAGRRSDCGCGRKEDPLYDMPLAMAYVPWQNWHEIYDICEGFQSGTIFEELNKPFLGKGGRKR